jgi:hypothetical protein
MRERIRLKRERCLDLSTLLNSTEFKIRVLVRLPLLVLNKITNDF